MLECDENATFLFRLSLWTNNAKKCSPETKAFTEIRDGAEVFVERVTSLKLYAISSSSAKMIQRNASRVEIVTKFDDLNSRDDTAGGDFAIPDSQSTEGNQTDHERLQTKKTARDPTTKLDQENPQATKKERDMASKNTKSA